MPVFHRNSANPAGYDPVPVGYDFINAPASNSPPGAGLPANFDGIKSGGPNDGSYFYAFGEDLTSANLNRPANALADNSDTLDNYLRRPIAIPTRTIDVTPGSPITTITLPGPPVPVSSPAVYLGTTSVDSFPENLASLFDILDNNDQEIVNPASGVRTVVTSITSTNGGDAVGSGFALGTITLHLNQAIPSGQPYRVYYGEKWSLSNMPPDALTIIKVRGATEVAAPVEDIIRQITNPGTVPEVVTSIAASVFQTPTNGRLPASNIMEWDIDPDGAGYTYWIFPWTRKINTGSSRVPMLLVDDPTGASIYAVPGTTGSLAIDQGMAFFSGATMLFTDENIRTGSGTNEYPLLPLSGNVSGIGDKQVRTFEVVPSYGSNTLGPSIISKLNARWTCTCGDGTVSFGDFSGANSLEQAIAYAQANSITNPYILLKSGTFTISSANDWTAGVLTIEGQGPHQTTIESVTGSGFLDVGGSASRLVVKGVNVTKGGSGVTPVLEGTTHASIDLEDVTFTNTTLLTIDITPTLGSPNALHARRCVWTQTTAGNISVDLQVGSQVVINEGYIFDDCSFVQSDETQTVRLYAYGPGLSLTPVSRVFFNRCQYLLGGTATTSSHLTHNTGVFEVNPNGSNISSLEGLILTDITWTDCKPTVATTDTNGILCRLYPVALGDTTASHLAWIQKATIRGGVWTAGSTGHTTAISPFLMISEAIEVQDVTFQGNAFSGGGPSAEDADTLGAGSLTAAQWSQFIFAPTASANSNALTSDDDDIRLTMKNVTFKNFGQNSGSGEVWLYMPNSCFADIANVRVVGYGTTGSLSRPNSRLQITTGATRGSIRDITVLGGDASGNSNPWTSAVAGTSGIIVFNPQDSGSSFEATVDCYDFHVEQFEYGGGVGKDDGVLLRNDGICSFNYRFANFKVGRQRIGISLYTSGGTTNQFDNFFLQGGTFSNNDGPGVYLAPDLMGHVEISGVQAVNNNEVNSGYGIQVSPKIWFNSGEELGGWLVFHGNRVLCGPQAALNSLVQTGVLISTATNNDYIRGSFLGNDVRQSDGTNGGMQFTNGYPTAPTALPSPAQVGLQTFVTGCETGWGSSPNLAFASGQLMMRNLAILYTP